MNAGDLSNLLLALTGVLILTGAVMWFAWRTFHKGQKVKGSEAIREADDESGVSEISTSGVRLDSSAVEGLLQLRRGRYSSSARYWLGPTGEYVIEIEGECDIYTADRLRQFFIEMVKIGRWNILLDLTRCEFLDSTSMGVLVGLLKRCRVHDGNVRIVCPEGTVSKHLHMTGLWKVFHIYATQDEAFAAAGKSASRGLSAGQIDRELEAHDWIPIRLYLSDATNHEQVEAALRNVVDEFGLEINYEFPAAYGSYWREFGARFRKRNLNPSEVEQQFAEIERKLRLQTVAEAQPNSLEPESKSVAQLITALQGTANAVIQLGPMLLVKHDNTVIYRNMSPLELILYERNPQVFRDPEAARHAIIAMERKKRRTSYSSDPADYRHGLNPRTKKIHLAILQAGNGQAAGTSVKLVARCGNANVTLEETDAPVSCTACIRIGSRLLAVSQTLRQEDPPQRKTS